MLSEDARDRPDWFRKQMAVATLHSTDKVFYIMT